MRRASNTKYHNLPRLAVASIILFVAISIWYFAYRIPLINPDAFVMSYLLLGAELFGMLSLILHMLGTWRLVERKAPAPKKGANADILITTWNEPVELLRNTLLAAKQVRLAGEIWLLDDGDRREMRLLAEELGVRYLTRKDRSDAKAGNLNNALKHTNADFVGIFDCDHAPTPEFFERTLGYFNDPGVAFVQTPQDFFNIDSFQHRVDKKHNEYWHEQTLFYRVIQAGKDYWNAAFFCGSCAVARTDALHEIGGIATGTITEDIHTSIRLHKNGWRSVYHSEALAYGLSPASHDQYDTQRLRWGRGAMQVWRKEGILFRGKLTLAQRLCYLASTVTYFEGWQKAIVYFMPMVVLLTGALPILWTGTSFILLFLAWLLSGMLVNETVGRGYTKTFWMEEYNFLRFYTFMNATLALIIPKEWRFRVTPKEKVENLKIPTRLAPQAFVIIGAACAIAVGSYFYFTRAHLPFDAYVANVIWLSINAMIAFLALRFAGKRLRQRRASHRFPIPVPVSLKAENVVKPRLKTFLANDVSSHGMRIYTASETNLADEITGVLHLPGSFLPFRASVVRRKNDAGGRHVHVKFNWKNLKDADALNACLYGNSLQWDVNNWIEADTRDFNPLRYAPFKRRRPQANKELMTWRFATLNPKSETPVRCLLRSLGDGLGNYMAISYQQPPSMDCIDISIDGLNQRETGLCVTGGQFYTVGKGVVYVTSLGRQASPQSLTLHRNPTWMHSVGDAA